MMYMAHVAWSVLAHLCWEVSSLHYCHQRQHQGLLAVGGSLQRKLQWRWRHRVGGEWPRSALCTVIQRPSASYHGFAASIQYAVGQEFPHRDNPNRRSNPDRSTALRTHINRSRRNM